MISFITFSDTKRVVSAGNKVIKCNKEVRVTFRCPQQVLFGAPAYSLRESRRVQAERPMESFWKRMGQDQRQTGQSLLEQNQETWWEKNRQQNMYSIPMLQKNDYIPSHVDHYDRLIT